MNTSSTNRPLRTALDFTDLPSDRSPRSEAARELGRLAVMAVSRGSALSMRYGHDSNARRRHYQGDFDARPGAMIEKESESIRAALARLTSDDAKTLDRKLDKYWASWCFSSEFAASCGRRVAHYRRRSARWT